MRNGKEHIKPELQSSLYVKHSPDGWYFDAEKARRDFEEQAYIDAEGVVRWKSNNSVPPDDCLAAFEEAGSQFDRALAEAVSDRELGEFLEAYRRNPPVYSGETLAEMRNEFGEGAEVVNIVTGRKIKL